MKKVLGISCSALVLLLAACGGGKSGGNGADTVATTNSSDPSSNPDYQKGLDLIAKSDCLTCHKATEKLIGPAYQDVANKYPNTPENVTMLAKKVIAGGQGVWGTTPMTAHTALSQSDAEAMVKYVMLLKSK